MGIRFLTCVYVNGKCKVAQYSNNSGYPADSGIKVLNFIKRILSDGTVDKFLENVKASSFMHNDDLLYTVEEFCGGNIDDDFKLVDFYRNYPQFDISTGVEVLDMLCESSLKLKDDLHRANDGIFTEYGYVIDFDSKTFEVYKGFNKKKLSKSDRFYTRDQDTVFNEFGSYPIRLLATFSFNGLPDDEQFLETLEMQEDESL